MSWLYITGRGHSGTTFLDIVLGNNQNIKSYGEIISGIDRLEDNCSCGEKMNSCQFWKDVMDGLKTTDTYWYENVKHLKNKSHVKYWPQLLLTGRYWKNNNSLDHINQNLHNSLNAADQSQYILDSSKEITRCLFILSTDPEAKVIHLVRNPKGVTSSLKKRFLKHGHFKFLRKLYTDQKKFFLISAVVGTSWTFGNFMIEISKLRFRNRILLIRHEDLLQDFDNTILKIQNFLNIDLSDIIEMHNENKAFQVGHNIGGNHLRMTREVTLDPSVNKQPEILSRFERSIVSSTTFPLRWLYRY